MSEKPAINPTSPLSEEPLRTKQRPPRRVLMVNCDGRSGDWHYTLILANALAREGLDVSIATFFPYDTLPNNPQTVPILRIGTRPTVWPNLFSIRRVSLHIEKLIGLLEALKQVKPEIVHLHKPLGILDILYFRLLRLFGIRVVLTVYGLLHNPRGLFQLGTYRSADIVLVHSQRTRDELIESGAPAFKIVKIEHGNFLDLINLDGRSSDEAKLLLDIPKEDRVILFFGAVEYRKGLDLLIEAFSIVLKSFADLRLAIAGFPVDDFQPYRDQMALLGIDHRVVLRLNWIDFAEMRDLFAAASLVVLPYRVSSQSGVLQLAYASERPVVVTDVGGMAESVAQDGTGFVASPEDPEELASAIARLLTSPEAARAMGWRGRKLAETKYSWTSVARHVAGLYESLISDGD